jgi:TolA-binding protein
MFRRICVWILVASPTLALAANKDIQELQRDVAQLQDMVKQLQTSQNKDLAELRALVQQSLNAANDANKAVAIIQNGFQQNLRDQEGKVVAPVVQLSSRMDSLSSDFRSLQGAVSDLTTLINKMQDRLTDINNNMKLIQSPAAPPPSQSGAPQASAPAASSCGGISATDLYTNAQRDYQAGHLDLALQEYSDFVRCNGNAAQAPRAQYYTGFIRYSQGDYEAAARDFDVVLEKYPHDDSQVPTALAYYYKGMSLAKAGRRTDAQSEFRDLMKQFPNEELSKQACTQLVKLGYNCTAPRPAAPAKAPAKAPARRKK